VRDHRAGRTPRRPRRGDRARGDRAPRTRRPLAHAALAAAARGPAARRAHAAAVHEGQRRRRHALRGAGALLRARRAGLRRPALGLAVQLYTLRSPDNWASATSPTCAPWCAAAQTTARLRRPHPLHALFPANPGISARTAFDAPLSQRAVRRRAGRGGVCRLRRRACAHRHRGVRPRTAAAACGGSRRLSRRGARQAARAACALTTTSAASTSCTALRTRRHFAPTCASGRTAAPARAARRHRRAPAVAGADRYWGWPVWPEELRDPAEGVRRFEEQHRVAVEFHAWLQWTADAQLAAVQALARDLGMPSACMATTPWA